MIRIYGDLKFNVSDIKNIGEKFIIKLYTTAKSVAIEKTDMDIVDGVIKLNWSELATIGRGVLQYELNNITEDADYDDGIYDSTYTGTTEYYIMSDISIDEDEAVEKLECWTPELQPGKELSRLAVAPDYQNHGLAREMLQYGMQVLYSQGYKSVHFLVNRYNMKALRSYAALNFQTVGECELYDQPFLCYEKALIQAQ